MDNGPVVSMCISNGILKNKYGISSRPPKGLISSANMHEMKPIKEKTKFEITMIYTIV